MTFQEKLVILRKNNRLTQDDFAKAVGVSRQAVYKWENGTSYPEIQKLIEMRELFNISLDNLFDDSYEIEVPEKKKKRRSAAHKAAPAVEAAPVVEAAPAVEAEPVVETAPVVEAEPVVEVAPVVEAEPVVEVAPEVEVEPVVEAVPEVEAEPVVEAVPEKKAVHVSAIKIEDLKDEELDGLRRIDVPVPEEEIKEEETEAPQEKKGGFFSRLFGRR